MSERVDLPGVLAEVAEVAGQAAALRLADARGGTEKTYVPRPEALTAEHWLVQALGWDDAKTVAARIGGGPVPIPLGPLSGLRGRVRTAIRRALAEGRSAAEVARLVGVHQRTVRRHRTGAPNSTNGGAAPDDKQRSLF